MDTLPLEIIKKIRLYAHPRINDQLKKDIHEFKFKKDTYNINITAFNYNILRVLDSMNVYMFV